MTQRGIQGTAMDVHNVSLTKKETGELFYCVAYERYRVGHWLPEMAYVHAHNSSQAELLVRQSEPEGSYIRIIGAAPAIGYHVEDKHGLILRA